MDALNTPKSKDKPKFNLSIGRLISRFLFTLLITILFGIGMFPFLRVADGLMFEQKAAIGSENMWRLVVLWGLYSFIFIIFTNWKKRFRMTGVWLIVFWILGTSIVLYIQFRDSTAQVARCKRSTPYVIPKEFERALDLIAQRLDVEKNSNSFNGMAFNYRNCLDIQYSENKSLNEVAEGAFLSGNSDLQDLKILVKPDYKKYDDLTIATILTHELTHVGQYIYKLQSKAKADCFDKEADAFTSQSIFLNQLNNEERRSIGARVREDISANPAFEILADVENQTTSSFNACSKLKLENNLTELQFNECVWTGTKNKLLLIVKKSPDYQKQCREN